MQIEIIDIKKLVFIKNRSDKVINHLTHKAVKEI